MSPSLIGLQSQKINSISIFILPYWLIPLTFILYQRPIPTVSKLWMIRLHDLNAVANGTKRHTNSHRCQSVLVKFRCRKAIAYVRTTGDHLSHRASHKLSQPLQSFVQLNQFPIWICIKARFALMHKTQFTGLKMRARVQGTVQN